MPSFFTCFFYVLLLPSRIRCKFQCSLHSFWVFLFLKQQEDVEEDLESLGLMPAHACFPVSETPTPRWEIPASGAWQLALMWDSQVAKDVGSHWTPWRKESVLATSNITGPKVELFTEAIMGHWVSVEVLVAYRILAEFRRLLIPWAVNLGSLAWNARLSGIFQSLPRLLWSCTLLFHQGFLTLLVSLCIWSWCPLPRFPGSMRTPGWLGLLLSSLQSLIIFKYVYLSCPTIPF